MTQPHTFAHYLAMNNLPDERTPERKQWDSVAADLITAKLTIEMSIDGADNADLPTAARMIDRAIDTLATIQKELTQ